MKISRLTDTSCIVSFRDGLTQVLVSYSTPVAAQIDGKEYKTDTFWSMTTSKHVNQFLRDSKHAEVREQWWFQSLMDGATVGPVEGSKGAAAEVKNV